MAPLIGCAGRGLILTPVSRRSLVRPGHGRWLIAPEDGTAQVTRRYRPNTLILEMRFENAEGAATLVDFMPGHQTGSSVVRLIIGERGRVAMRTELVIRFGYGATVPWMMRLDDGTRRAVVGPDISPPLKLVNPLTPAWV